MGTHRASVLLLALAISGLVAGCGVLPAPILDGDVIVLQVMNNSPRPIPLTVGMPGDERRVVGSVDPPVVPPGMTVMARFLVPQTGAWAIFAGGGELIGSVDVRERRGNLPMGIDISRDGSQSWWCKEACP